MFFSFTCVLVEVQFLGHKFGLKGSTYTRENKVTINYGNNDNNNVILHWGRGSSPWKTVCFSLTGISFFIYKNIIFQ